MFDINFYSRIKKETLDILCKVPWYTLSLEEDGARKIEVDLNMLDDNNIPRHLIHAIDNKFTAGNLISIVEAIKNGPKVIKPTLEQCLALSNVELLVPYKYYKQTYPVLFIEFPYEFFQWGKENYDLGINAVTIHQYHSSVCLTVYFKREDRPTIIYSYQRSETFTLEESINELCKNYANGARKEEIDICRLVFRIAINLNLLMTNYGHEVKDWVDPKRHKKNPKPTDIQIIAVNQRIKIYERKESEDHGGTHSSPHPHWRRGHWRNQPVKEGYRQIFIAPMFIGKRNFIGSLKDTYVQYTVQ